jgi:hypothetical protein
VSQPEDGGLLKIQRCPEAVFMQLFSSLNKLINKDKKPVPAQPPDDQLETRPMRIPNERTRPSRSINDQKWLKIQKAIDQAG